MTELEKLQIALDAARGLLRACRNELETDPHAQDYYAELIAEIKAFLAGGAE